MSTEKSNRSIVVRAGIALIIVITLLLLPAPVLPPHYWSEKLQFYTGANWKFAYLVVAIGLQAAIYFVIGVLSAFLVRRAATVRKLLLQIAIVPIIIVVAALLIRSLKMGHFPVWINAAIPMGACIAGVWLGLGLLYRQGMMMIVFTVVVMGVTFWAISGTMTPELTTSTENQLTRLTQLNQSFPNGDQKFGALLQTAFKQRDKQGSAVQQNRAAILALGIAIGHERLSRFVDLDRKKELLKQAAKLRNGTTLHERNDWSRHFCLSAALAVLENPLVSDAGGLLKEQLDALTGGSGFSFGDIAADRAGVRFAQAATRSEEDARAMQEFMKREYDVNNFLPPAKDLPENMTTEQFRARYGSTGSQAYRDQVNLIESRLDSCKALSPLVSAN